MFAKMKNPTNADRYGMVTAPVSVCAVAHPIPPPRKGGIVFLVPTTTCAPPWN